jgi:hypothetical protein
MDIGLSLKSISGIDLIAVAYAWSQRGCSSFVSTCGNTTVSSVLYQSDFQDDFGNVDFKMLPRPQVCHFLYEYLPIIDEHNNQRQNVLGLEQKWPTKDCWFHLLVTLVGMCVVDMHHWYTQEKKVHNRLLSGTMCDNDARVIGFIDLLCGGLVQRERLSPAVRPNLQDGQETILTRIEVHGKTNCPPTMKNLEKGKTLGQLYYVNCFIFMSQAFEGRRHSSIQPNLLLLHVLSHANLQHQKGAVE